MKKNIVITVLAALVVMFGLYAFAQKAKADQFAEERDRGPTHKTLRIK